MLEQIAEQYQHLSLQVKAIIVASLFIGSGYFSYSDNVTTAQQALQIATDAEAKLTTDIANFNKSGQSLSSIEAQKRKAEQELLELFALLPRDLEIDVLIANFSDSAKASSVKMTSLKPEGSTDATTLAPPPVAPASTPAPASTSTPAPATTAEPASTASSGLPAQDFTSKTAFSVNIEGSFPQIVTFFDRVLNLKRVIRLDSFELTPITATAAVAIPGMSDGSTTKTEATHDGSPILSAKVKFAVFMQKGDSPNLQLTPNIPAATQTAAAPSATPEGLSAKPLAPAPGEK
jgi:Tfp pilus assembly protein PilO